jgi:uncharacterized small protein (DUF1192 family)
MAAISHKELSQRVAVLKRFKELLKAQRDRFSAYLDSLDRQKDVIERGTADDLLRYVDLEEKIVTDIFSIQKVIDPLDKMYHSAVLSSGGKTSDVDEVSDLKKALESLKSEAVVRSERNKELLSARMAEIRSEIKSLRSNPYAKRGYGNSAAPTQIDIRG